jgi:hypothetical protein
MKVFVLFLLVAAYIFPLNIPITVQEALSAGVTGKARTDEPVTVGIPLKDADGITQVSQLGLSAVSAGQFRILRRYHSGNIQWVLCDFLASVTAGDTLLVSLTDGSGSFGGTDLAADNGATITINTGAAQFTVRKARFNVLHQATVNGQAMLSDSTGAIVSLDSSDVVYTSLNDAASTAQIEENGPVKAVVNAMGRLKDNSGAGHLWYTVRLFFYKGADYVRMEVTIRNADRSLLQYNKFNAFSVNLPLALAGNPSFTFTGNTSAQTWTGQVASGDSAHLFQGFVKYLQHGTYWQSCYIWDPPAPGTCATDFTYTYDISKGGLEVANGASVLQALGDTSKHTMGWADFTDSQNKGASVAMRWMPALWPASYEIASDGNLEIGIFSRFNPKTITCAWGYHETREIMIDFHTAAQSGEATLYSLQYPMVGRAPYTQYREAKSLGNEGYWVSLAEENQYYAKYGHGNPVNWTNPGISFIRRYEHWRRGYSEHERNLIQFLRTGFGGEYLRGEQQVRFNADKPVMHSDGFVLSDYPNQPVLRPDGSMNQYSSCQNCFDGEHQETMSFWIYYYMSGDERVRDAIIDYGEYLLRNQKRSTTFDLDGNDWRRGSMRTHRNLSWVYEFTQDTNYIKWVMWDIDSMMRRDGAIENGTEKNRGYLWGGVEQGGQRTVHSFFETQIGGETFYQSWRILREHDHILNFAKLEDYEDILLGIALFHFEEAAWVSDSFVWIRYDYKIDNPNPELDPFFNYVASRWCNHIYHMTGDTQYYYWAEKVFHDGYNGQNGGATINQNQALMYTDFYRPPPIYGWTPIPFTETDNGGGSYTLSWTVPANARRYKIKYGEKEIVDWLGFDQITRQFAFDTSQYMAWFAASNVPDEPVPTGQGTTQSHTITGLDPGKTWHFDVRVSKEPEPILLENKMHGAQSLMLTAYPNPFYPVTALQIRVPVKSAVLLEIYDINGRLVTQFDKGKLLPGLHRILWNGLDKKGQRVGNGIYIARLRAGKKVRINKLTLIR